MNTLKNQNNNKKNRLKHLSYYSLSTAVIIYLILVSVFITSCSKDDSPISQEEGVIELPNEIRPTISLLNGEEGTYLGVVGSPTQGSLQHEIKAIAPDGFVSLEIFKVLDDVATSYILLDTNDSGYEVASSSLTHSLNYIMNNENEAGRSLKFKAVVTDANNNTATLDFAEVDLRLPMIKTTVMLNTTLPPVGDITIPYYLLIKDENVTVVNHDVAVGVNDDEFIAIAFSVNDGSGFYLGSLNIVEPVISNGMAQKSTTKFKHHINAAETPIFNIWDIYDVHNVEHAFSVLSYNSHEQKAEQVSTIGKVFYFKTDDNKTGLFQVKSFNLAGDDASLELDIFVIN